MRLTWEKKREAALSSLCSDDDGSALATWFSLLMVALRPVN
jgi:hypothetical protein